MCALPLLMFLAALVTGYVVGGELPDLESPTPVTDEARPQVVALGDSFIAGEGAPRYLLGTHGPANRCHRARTAYPYLVAKEFQYRLTSVACSGAVTSNLVLDGQYDEPRQIDALRRAGDAALVLASIGGNDAGFGDVVRSCLRTDCLPARDEWMRGLDKVGQELISTYAELARVVPRGARVLVLEYPAPFRHARCIPGLSEAEARWVVQDFLPRLNYVIRFAAEGHGFEVVDAEAAFAPAMLCERKFDEAAMNMFTLSRSRWFTGLVTGSFHPTPIGHRLLADAVLDHLATRPPPTPRQAPGPGVPPLPDVPPPYVPGGPPTGPYPFPSGTACAGDSVASERAVETARGQGALEVRGRVGSRWCARPYLGVWGSGPIGREGYGVVDVSQAASARTRYIEVLTVGDDGQWTRTLVFPPPIGDSRLPSPWRLLGVAVTTLVLAVVTCVAPYVRCRRLRRTSS